MNRQDFTQRVLEAMEFDLTGQLWWRRDDNAGLMRFFIRLADGFMAYGADLEEITPENIAALEQAIADCRKVAQRDDLWGPDLFAARLRKKMPTLRYLITNDVPQSIQQLFREAAGC